MKRKLCHQKIEKDASDVPVGKLIDQQIDDRAGLKREEKVDVTLFLIELLLRKIEVEESKYQETSDKHHNDDTEELFEAVAKRVIVFVVVKFF